MMDLPKKLKIGPVSVDVIIGDDVKRFRTDSGSILNGYADYTNAEIGVNRDTLDKCDHVVLWHEVIHFLLYQAGITDHSESMVVALGYAVAQAVRDNPDLVKFTAEHK